MICNAKIFIERILENKTFGEKEKGQVEILLRDNCHLMKALQKAYTDLIIKEDQARRDQNDPSTQEQGHESWWSKVRKK